MYVYAAIVYIPFIFACLYGLQHSGLKLGNFREMSIEDKYYANYINDKTIVCISGNLTKLNNFSLEWENNVNRSLALK